MTDETEPMFWREKEATAAAKAIGHAWVGYKFCPAGLIIEVNGVPALRLSIKYRASGPYIAIETGPGSGDTMGFCLRTAGMVKRYTEILEAHNALGALLHASRSFVISDEEKARAKIDAGAGPERLEDAVDAHHRRQQP